MNRIFKITSIVNLLGVLVLVNISGASALDLDVKDSWSKGYENGFKFNFEEKGAIPVNINGKILASNKTYELAFPQGWYAIKYFSDESSSSNVRDILEELVNNYNSSIPGFDKAAKFLTGDVSASNYAIIGYELKKTDRKSVV